ncbi:MAG TPA: PqqD family peptide modification chaperone [Mycobacteriales bacterium]|jgi:hypothetical protein|nr:PqqD family peptide modification chaperone [Mycobacteriales bacterium]
MTLPSRASGVIDRSLGDETILYDTRSDQVHLLDPLAAAVWNSCDGASHSAGQLVAAVRAIDPAADSRTVDAALSRLDEIGVLAQGMSRRTMLMRAAAVGTGVIVIPTVTSLVGPVVAAHASTMHTIVLQSTAQTAGKRDPAIQACDTATGTYIAAYAFTNSTYSTVAGTGWVSFNNGGSGANQHYYYRIPFTLPTGFNHASITLTGYTDDSAVVWLNAPTTASGGTQIGTVGAWNGTATTFTYNATAGWTAGTHYLYFVEFNSGGGAEGIDFSATITYSA